MKPNYFHSVILEPDRCIGCTYCLKVCPTEAIRLKGKKAHIIDERCIDCGECIRKCPNHAKSSITDNKDIIKQYKYSIALTLPILYGQFNRSYSTGRILSAVKSLGFDEVMDTSMGAEIVGVIGKQIINNAPEKPVISSTCPAILRLIQVRFPELLKNVFDVETPVEITARLAKQNAHKNTGISMDDIGVILITPCTARITSIKNPLGIDFSYIDGAISIKDIFGHLIKALSSGSNIFNAYPQPTYNGMLWSCAGGQAALMDKNNSLSVDGIQNAISVLEEIEMGRFSNLSFIELMACPGGCPGGPLVVENRYVALNNIKSRVSDSSSFNPSQSETLHYMSMYDSGFIKLTKKIEPKLITRLDPDLKKSIEKMDLMQDLVNKLPGIDCGICGSPTCRAFAEDIVTGQRIDCSCPVAKYNKNIL